MRIAQIGLDNTTALFLRESGVIIEDTGKIENVEDLEAWIGDGRCDAVVVDLSSGNFGVYTARHLRTKKINTPVIGISLGSADRSWPEERAIFLENGGDDLLRGPVNPRELVASLRAMSRRFQGAMANIVEFQYGGAKLKLNLTTRSVFINGREPSVTDTEREILLHFASHPSRVLSKEALMENLYALRPDDQPEIKIIDVFVCKLRRKMSEIHPDAEKFVETIWGRGYRLISEASGDAAA